MSSMAREMAVLALLDRAGNVTSRLDSLLAHQMLSAPDKAFARELALGIVRRRGTLNAVLRAFLAEPGRRLPSPLTEIFQVGLYQIVMLSRVPDFAAVNETVQLTIDHHHKRQAGLVNGVLRNVARCVSERIAGAAPLAAGAIPIDWNTYRTIKKPIFPDPGGSPAEYLAAAYSLPEELARRWLARCGSLQEAIKLAAHANTRAPLILRVNALKSSPDAVQAALTGAGLGARRHANGSSIVLSEHRNVRDLDVFCDGLVQPQDPAATAVVAAADPKAGMKVLDLCAAPGTKTTHLAELMDNRGSILAVDVSEEKLQRIQTNCARLGVSIVSTMVAQKVGALEAGSFDLVLADVPCSNTGVLARRAEARWHFSEPHLARLVKDQQFLAAAAARFVRPGGRLVYSTCSIEPEECGELARGLAQRTANLELLEEKLMLPEGADDATKWRDGGYYAVFRAK